MTPPAPQFRPVAAAPLDVSDAEIIQLSDDLGIPALVKPEPKPSEAPAPAAAPELQNLPKEAILAPIVMPPAPASKKRVTAQKIAVAVEPDGEGTRRISVDMPIYLAEQIRRRVFEERTSARYYILTGLKALGFEVRDSDLVPDARRE